jgi:hypothetical protein
MIKAKNVEWREIAGINDWPLWVSLYLKLVVLLYTTLYFKDDWNYMGCDNCFIHL